MLILKTGARERRFDKYMAVVGPGHQTGENARSSFKKEPSKNRFLALVQESFDVYWVLTSDGEMREISSSWQDFTGQKARECSDRDWRDAFHPADLPEMDEALAHALISGHAEEATCQVRSYTNTYRLLQLRVIPVRANDDSVHELMICGKDVTKRKLHLRMVEAWVQLALKASRVGMWDWDIVADRIAWTDQCKELFGWPLTGKLSISYNNFLNCISPADRNRVDRLNSRALSEKTEFYAEYRVIWPDGSVHWLADRGRGIYNARGKPIHMVGACIDITDLTRAQERAEKADSHVKIILESITDCFSSIDTEDRYVYINKRLEAYSGKKREEMLGKTVWEVYPSLRGTAFEQAYYRALETREAVHIELFLPQLQVWQAMRLYPTEDGISIFSHDITENKRIEEALRASEARFRHFVDSNVIGIIVSSLQGQIYEANDAFLAMVGYTRADLDAGKLNWLEMTPPEYQDHEQQVQDEMRATGVFQPFEKEYITQEGKRVPALVGGALFHHENCLDQGNKDDLEIAFILDLNAQKAMERQKDLFLGMASHELKTPLAALKGTLQLAERGMKRLVTTLDEVSPQLDAFRADLAKYLTTAVRQVDIQTHLIDNLLDISRITSNSLELSLHPCDLVAIVREIVADVRVTAPERSILLNVPDEITALTWADAERIGQVITNYLTNALRYSPPDKPIEVGLDVRAKNACLWVKDQGPGLSREECQKIWQSFHKARTVPVQNCGSGKGLGLGLYICQTLIEQHHGQVGVESVQGQGSTFWFTLPLAR